MKIPLIPPPPCALLALILLFTPSASAQHTVVYLGPLDSAVDPGLYSSVDLDCLLGRRTAAVPHTDPDPFAIGFGFPGHYTVFAPWEGDCPCRAGYFFHAVHLVFTCHRPEGCLYDFDVDLVATCHRDDPRCSQWWPWSSDAPGMHVQGAVPGPGYFEMTVPTVGWGCAYPDFRYGFTFGTLNEQPGILFGLDDSDGALAGDGRWWTIGERICSSPSELPGAIVAWADIVCCEIPVETEHLPWGALKARFR